MVDKRTGVRGVLGGIDRELERVNKQLAGYDELVAERRRLLAARATLSGDSDKAPRMRKPRISQDDVAAYLAQHPDSWPADIAAGLGVPVTNVSAHLHRGKHTRFLRGGSGWRLRRHA